jgi:CheY-like chemotaxis protein
MTADLESTPMSCKIVIADDNPVSMDELAILLQVAGHNVITAREGLDVLEIIELQKPDAVLLDVALPGIDPYRLAQTISARTRSAEIILVALTNSARAHDRERIRRAGFHHCLVKPVDPCAIQEILAQRPRVPTRR